MIPIVHVNGYSLAEIPGKKAHDQLGKRAVCRFGDWERVCWGNRTVGTLGRIPTALFLARTIGARRIIWSTGATREQDGIFESEYLYERALGSYEALMGDFPHRCTPALWKNEKSYRAWLRRISELETDSTNTPTSMMRAYEIVRDRYKNEDVMFYTVSSANHLPRVLRDACVAFGIGTRPGGHSSGLPRVVVAVPAETNYGGVTVSETVVRDLGD